MSRYVFSRLLAAVPVLLGISVLAFALGVLSPGDPAEFALNQNGLAAPTEAEIAAMREQLGLNRPLAVQYASWAWRVLQGDFGSSYITGRDIADELLLRLPVTLKLALMALLLAGIGGSVLGVLCAVKRGSILDNVVKNLANAMLSIPSFWLALVLILVFSEKLRWLPTSGSQDWRNFILPAFAVSFASMGTICRFMRGMMLAEFSRQYYLVGRVHGLKRWQLLRYAFTNAAVPVLALLGNYFAGVLGGSVIAESIFAVPGISSMAMEAIRFRDYPVLQAYVLVCGWSLVLVTLAVDVLIACLNPKVRLGE